MEEKNEQPFLSRRKAISSVAALSMAAAIPGLARGKDAEAPHAEASLFGSSAPIYLLNRGGTSRQFTTFDPATKQKAPGIQPGEKKTLVSYEGAGIITRLWMTFSGWFWMYWEPHTYIDQTILKKLIFRIYWDGQPYPSVEAPIGDFFGIGLCEYKPYLSQFIGLSSGGFYNYFPMPFEKGVRIEVENMHEKVVPYVFLNANYQAYEKLPGQAGRFHCLYHAGTHTGAEPLEVLQAEGRGHFVGCCLSIQGKERSALSFLEAPEYVYIDTEDTSSPTIVGTGMEDFFNGGWYFREGEFNAPYHGVPIKDVLNSTVCMYRFFEEDAIGFQRRIALKFISPRSAEEQKDHPFKYASTAYWYQDKASRLAFTLPSKEDLVDWYRIRATDHQSIP